MEINLKERVLEVLQKGHLMSLGTMDAEGVWVADILYIFDDNFNVYWMSSPNTRHSKAVELNTKAAGTITLSNKSKENNFGIQFEGHAEKIEDLDLNIAKQHAIKRGNPVPETSKDILRPGASWYKLTLKKLYLIDEKNFGFKRQEVNEF